MVILKHIIPECHLTAVLCDPMYISGYTSYMTSPP